MGSMLAASVATLVFCAPGYPGEADDAQPLLDQFTKALVANSGWPAGSLTSVYDPTEQGGLARLRSADAVLAFVPYPFFVEHAAQLHLTPLVEADVVGVGPQQRWSLVAKSERVASPASLGGFTLLSTAGYAPNFVRAALAGWTLPPNVTIEASGQILSALRRAAAGEPVAVLLDRTQTAALAGLPFAGELKVVTESPALPVALVAVVDSRLSKGRAAALKEGLLGMGHSPPSAEVLAPLRLRGFVQPELKSRTAAP
jgi:hypothetical protein